jgi:hypothetical protein
MTDTLVQPDVSVEALRERAIAAIEPLSHRGSRRSGRKLNADERALAEADTYATLAIVVERMIKRVAWEGHRTATDQLAKIATAIRTQLHEE